MTDILMPRLSDTMTEGAVATWHKRPGDRVIPGDLLVEIETDKAVMEHEAYEAGTLAEILVPEGRAAAIGAPIARLTADSPAASPSPAVPAPPSPAGVSRSAAAPPSPESGVSTASAAVPPVDGAASARRAATPLVRRLARERGIDLSTVPGTGPGGRIVRADLDRSGTTGAAVPPATGDGHHAPQPGGVARGGGGTDRREPTAVPFDGVRQTIAARLTASAGTVPTFTVTASAVVDDLLDLRARVNTALDGPKVTVNDLLVRAVARALRAHPGVNASYSPEGRGQSLLHGRVHVGVAVASPAGLIVPVIHDADRASVTDISARTRELAERAANRTLGPADLADATFTISNLGMYGIESFTAIVNPPQGAILAVGAVREEPAVGGGALRRLRCTLTADHRIIDGALAARFLATLTGLLESPLTVLA